jgi:hypothetical protein
VQEDIINSNSSSTKIGLTLLPGEVPCDRSRRLAEEVVRGQSLRQHLLDRASTAEVMPVVRVQVVLHAGAILRTDGGEERRQMLGLWREPNVDMAQR